MKRNIITIAFIASLTGCMATQQATKSAITPTNSVSSQPATTCVYESMPGAEFSYTGESKYFSLYFEDDQGYLGRSNIGETLKGKKFKFSGNLKPDHKAFNKYPKVLNIQGKDYSFDSNVSTAVMFEGCSTALWFKGHVNYNALIEKKGFEKTNASPFDANDLAYAYGTENVKEASYEPIITTDEFADSSTIKTEYQDRILLRTWSNGKLTRTPKVFQVYADLLFLNDWGHIRTARTKDGKVHELTRIDTDVDCSGSFGCSLTETVGVTLPLSMLEKNPNGFEIKFYGTREQVVSISSYHVKTLLAGISQIK
ncbi:MULTISPECIES: hypothetical protein [Vibrio]|uniref:hypothetical protein n=1 Tax=Vibrio TaxID=662 RepID=UPI0022CD4C4E|nr:hypothetical protein [Vibrio sp. MM46]MDA0125983.1 hypothetical protein [Vibrio sp. MM46]